MIDQEWSVEEIKDEVAVAVIEYETEKIRKWLENNYYDGLYNDEVGDPACGCDISNFATCDDGPYENCVAAHKRDDGMHPGKRESEKDRKCNARRIRIPEMCYEK